MGREEPNAQHAHHERWVEQGIDSALHSVCSQAIAREHETNR